jgi:hypothetical protein
MPYIWVASIIMLFEYFLGATHLTTVDNTSYKNFGYEEPIDLDEKYLSVNFSRQRRVFVYIYHILGGRGGCLHERIDASNVVPLTCELTLYGT